MRASSPRQSTTTMRLAASTTSICPSQSTTTPRLEASITAWTRLSATATLSSKPGTDTRERVRGPVKKISRPSIILHLNHSARTVLYTPLEDFTIFFCEPSWSTRHAGPRAALGRSGPPTVCRCTPYIFLPTCMQKHDSTTRINYSKRYKKKHKENTKKTIKQVKTHTKNTKKKKRQQVYIQTD